MVLVRKTAAAGRFYPKHKSDLKEMIKQNFLDKNFGPGEDFIASQRLSGDRKVIGAVFPHAGYTYSGPAAALSCHYLFEEGVPDIVIILGTTHTGYRGIALMDDGKWESPLSPINIDSVLAKAIITSSNRIKKDNSAFNGSPHGREHCIEVQIPFIQYCAHKALKVNNIVPIKVGVFDFNELEIVGKEIADAIKKVKGNGKDIAIIASSDMTHYQPRVPFNAKAEIEAQQIPADEKVIASFKKFDIENVLNNAKNTTVCGPQTITLLMLIAKSLGYQAAESIKYYTSFQKTGEKEPCDYSVGYFSGIIKKKE